MRIVYLFQYFNTPEMSGGTRAYEMARRLVAAGHEVHMVTSDRQPESGQAEWYETEAAGIRVHWFPNPYSNTMGFKERLKSFFRFSYGAARKAASLEADLVFASSTPLTIALPAVYAAKRQRVPMVFEVRDLWPHVPIEMRVLKGAHMKGAARRLERFAYRNAAQIVALSPGMRDGVVATGYPADRVHVIPNSSDLELFDVPREVGQEFRSRYDWLGNRPLVVYTGTLGNVNGVGYLARLAAEVRPKNPEVRFLVVGSGKEESEVRALAAKLGVLDETFFMLGRIPKRDMPAVLSAADIATSLVIDNRALWANSANKFFDGLASRTPFAVNHGGWQAEMLEETGAGLVLDPHDLSKASDLLVQRLGDGAWLERAGKEAYRLATERFARDKLAKELEGVLERACREHGRVAGQPSKSVT